LDPGASTIAAEDFDAARSDLDIVIPQVQEEFDLISGPNGRLKS
jgi:hypothetical protein